MTVNADINALCHQCCQGTKCNMLNISVIDVMIRTCGNRPSDLCLSTFQPAVCSGELCVFSFQTLGVMSEAAEDIATAAEV